MCNLYDVGPAPNREHGRWVKLVREGISRLPKIYHIRKTDAGLVLRNGDDGVLAEKMRWGFSRPFNNSVNNARSDKLDGGMWRKAFENCRCVIPVAGFYEWTGTKGNKQAHAVRRDDRDWLWAAGVWEENSEEGRCFSMITTAAPEWFSDYHHRLPAFIGEEQAVEFLKGKGTADQLVPWAEELEVMRCESPLKKSEPGPPVEDSGWLFEF